MAEGSPFKHEQADDSPGFLLWKLTALWQEKLAGVLALRLNTNLFAPTAK